MPLGGALTLRHSFVFFEVDTGGEVDKRGLLDRAEKERERVNEPSDSESFIKLLK